MRGTNHSQAELCELCKRRSTFQCLRDTPHIFNFNVSLPAAQHTFSYAAVQEGQAREAELGAQLAASAEKLSVKERELAETRQLAQVRQANVDMRAVHQVQDSSLCFPALRPLCRLPTLCPTQEAMMPHTSATYAYLKLYEDMHHAHSSTHVSTAVLGEWLGLWSACFPVLLSTTLVSAALCKASAGFWFCC